MARPARAGPTTRPRFHWAWLSDMAASSCSSGTRSGNMAAYAGNPTPATHPAANTTTATAPGDARSVMDSAVRSTAHTIWAAVMATSNRRRSSRSAMAPPMGPSSPMGKNPAAATSAVHPA